MSSTDSSKVVKTEQGMAVSGRLVYASVTRLLKQSMPFLQQQQNESVYIIDCKAVTRVDSAGIALLLDWHRQCKDANKHCRFENLSKQAETLLNAYKLDALIAA